MKTAKEKMIAGEPYRADGRELFDERQKAKEVLMEYNNLAPACIKDRARIIKNLFGKTGKAFWIEPPFRCDYGYNIEIGENFYANFNLTILDCALVAIGDNVMFGPNVSLFTAGHPIHAEPRVAGWEYALPIHIGDNCWIGGNTVINAGITIGENTVIGSGSVVTKSIPANVVAVGNPCRVIKTITEEDKAYYYKDRKF
ncbi:sugar O-acetyltransferase [Sphingobacterium corticibacter]|uniref:Acetyltransferase n=1 Tax=Sphingobacterium corticibacter TaxID=2171749 RepID=A0A2T8HMQ5_9SPHI|nr:sugar O-acetyltransferase [Sphingobacterium corticibacter]PVH26729.1 maltose O-acetyltransferase [Sphingobacterium corticibacter]